MVRRFLHQYGDRESVNDIFLANERQLRKNRKGSLYLQLRLSDRSGSANGMMWNVTEGITQAFNNGDFVRVEGTTQYYNGALQIIANNIERAEPGDVNHDDFVHISPSDIEALRKRLADSLRGIDDFHLRNLAECFLIDDALMEKFVSAPAGVKNHHAHRGGLLQHVISLMDLVRQVTPLYPQLKADALLMGAFLHDIGKVEELTYEPDLGYSTEGQLLGHVVLGLRILENKIEEAVKLSGEPFPAELALQLKHMIVSHHGQYEFGSPKLPMTLEAVTLHLLDTLDAKIHHFEALIREDVNADSDWTTYHANIGRKIYKGRKG